MKTILYLVEITNMNTGNVFFEIMAFMDNDSLAKMDACSMANGFAENDGEYVTKIIQIDPINISHDPDLGKEINKIFYPKN